MLEGKLQFFHNLFHASYTLPTFPSLNRLDNQTQQIIQPVDNDTRPQRP